MSHVRGAAQDTTVPQWPANLDVPTQLLLESIREMNVVDVRKALDNGADVDVVNKEDGDKTVLHMVAAQSSEACLMVLLKHSRKPKFCTDSNGQTPQHICAKSSITLTSLVLLIATYGMTEVQDHHGDTFLHCLMRNINIPEGQQFEFVRWVTAQEASSRVLNKTNHKNETVLDVVLKSGRYSGYFLDVLLRSGAREGKDIFTIEHRNLMDLEDKERRKIIENEGKRWRRLYRTFIKYHSLLNLYLSKRARVVNKEEYGRCQLWLREHNERGFIATQAVEGIVRINTMERERRVMKWKEEKEEEKKQQIQSSGVLMPLLATEEKTPIHKFVVSPDMDAPSGGAIPHHTLGTVVEHVSNIDVEKTLQRNRERTAVTAIMFYYRLYKKRKLRKLLLQEWLQETVKIVPEAVLRIQAHGRAYLVRRECWNSFWSILMVQRVWRQIVLNRRRRAIDIIRSEIERCCLQQRVKLFIVEGLQRRVKERIRGVMRAVTQLLWRENFCAAFCEIVFRRKRERSPNIKCESRFKRLQKLQLRMLKWFLLVQFLLALFMTVFLGTMPESSNTQITMSVDITVSLILLLMQLAMPLQLWQIFDCIIIFTGFICACTKCRSGVCILMLLTLKLPFVIREFFPGNSGTSTYCRAIEQAGFHLILLSPLGLAGVGSAIRGLLLSDALLTRTGNWGSVFLAVWSTPSQQYMINQLEKRVESFEQVKYPLLNVLPAQMQMSKHYFVEGDYILLQERTSIVQLLVANLILLFWTWTAVILGVHDAIRKHYDISDETKLRKDKSRFRDTKKMELLNEAHRAKNMTALGKQLDGLLWEADVRAAKEAIDASHYDHKADNTVHKFVRRVQDSVIAGEMELGKLNKTGISFFNARITAEWGKWDCRNEHPESRFMYDIGIIEAALGMRERRTFAEKLMRRQWIGPVSRRETTVLMVVVVVMAIFQPNNYWMEMTFSIIFAVELILSLLFLRIEFIFSHYIRLIIRLFCVAVGFIPSAIPFVVFRCLRFCEGWSSIFQVSGMTRYGIAYTLLTFVNMWMICFVAMKQLGAETKGRSICNGELNCFLTSVREMVLPTWTPININIVSVAPVAYLIIIVFQLVFVPFAVTIALHPLLQLSSFIGRFIRLVVQSLHHDVVEYINSYVEGPLWFLHWRLHSELPAAIITKLRMWVYDVRRRAGEYHRINRFSLRRRARISNASYVSPVAYACEGEDGKYIEESIVSRSQFASFEENEVYHNPSVAKHRTFLRLSRALRQPIIHYINSILTVISVLFLWAVDASSTLKDPVALIAIVFHVISMISSVVLIPRDASAILTLVSVVALAVSLGLQYSHNKNFRSYFCIRFLSLLRLGQVHVPFLFRIHRFTRMRSIFFKSGFSILFPVIVTGVTVCIVELLRSQVYLVKYYNPLENNETSEDMWSLPRRLASQPRRNKWYPNGDDTRELLRYYFSEDMDIFFSLFNLWVLPACCVATVLTYLRWVNTNLLDSQCLVINAIQLLEDPLTLARFKTYRFYFRWIGHVFLVLSLLFGIIISPTTDATSDDHKLFFAIEVFFTCMGFIDSFLRLVFAIHRCISSWAAWACMPRVLLEKGVLVGNTILLLAELVQLLYWSCAFPLALTLLVERNSCLIDPNSYALYFITLRFLLLIRMLPRQYVLSVALRGEVFIFAGGCVVVYFIAAASALADAYVGSTGVPMSTQMWAHALGDLCRQTLTSAGPVSVRGLWTPPNYTHIIQDMLASNESIRVVTTDYTSWPFLLGLAVVGKVVLASVLGLTIGAFFVPLRFLIFGSMPKQASFLYETLRGGTDAIVDVGARLHDDMRPDDRKKIQHRKFTRVFRARGIPMWLLPHLLEELCLFKPGQQRRLMFILEQLFVFLPIAEKRARCVAEYTDEWDLYSIGGPGCISFTTLPVYPEETHAGNNDRNTVSANSRYISPLRLVQVLALLEYEFPPHSSVGSKIWLEFFKVAQRIRGATLMQSLWRMYSAVKTFEMNTNRSMTDIIIASRLRRAFRRNRMLSRVSFLRHTTFEEAVRFQPNIFNPGTGHYDVLNRLRNHFTELQPTKKLCPHKSAGLSSLLSSEVSTLTVTRGVADASTGNDQRPCNKYRNPLEQTPRDFRHISTYLTRTTSSDESYDNRNVNGIEMMVHNNPALVPHGNKNS
ncbi:IQ motif [Trypanosoma melophagium]|uniref:IQ motif n=1 Tax=Trypanosoma melophagium TaxID=715481 RepID=UPI00351A06C8|nr:IQ motif [Trypanosoma melophagium]